MAIRTLAYECKFCGALKRSKTICERHEETCLQNPNAKNCIRCEHHEFNQVQGITVCSITGKKCSSAVSAKCQDFKRVELNETKPTETNSGTQDK